MPINFSISSFNKGFKVMVNSTNLLLCTYHNIGKRICLIYLKFMGPNKDFKQQ